VVELAAANVLSRERDPRALESGAEADAGGRGLMSSGPVMIAILSMPELDQVLVRVRAAPVRRSDRRHIGAVDRRDPACEWDVA